MKAESSSERYVKNTQYVSHWRSGLSQHSRGGQAAMATARTTQPGSSLCPPALVPPVPVCPLCAGTRAGQPVPWLAEQLQELCLRSHSPSLPERIKLQIYYQGKGELPSHHMYLNASATKGRSSPSQEQLSSSHLSYVFPAANRVLCSVTSNSLFHVSPGCLMSWKHLPVPRSKE